MEHYSVILNSALSSGYTFKGFQEDISATDKAILLRHDVDVSLSIAADMAEVEASLGVHSTYFLLTNSPLYNMFEDKSIENVFRIINSGNRVGLHVDLPESFHLECSSLNEYIETLYRSYSPFFPLEKTVSFHRPAENVLNQRINPPFINTYEPRFFSDMKYLSDSNKTWREGCPCAGLKRGSYTNLQLLIHPIWWTGETDMLTLGRQILGDRYNELQQYLMKNITPFMEVM